jgi:hypothetical protein
MGGSREAAAFLMKDTMQDIMKQLTQGTEKRDALLVAAALLDYNTMFPISVMTSSCTIDLKRIVSVCERREKYAYVWLPLLGVFCVNGFDPLDLDKTPLCEEIDDRLREQGYTIIKRC